MFKLTRYMYFSSSLGRPSECAVKDPCKVNSTTSCYDFSGPGGGGSGGSLYIRGKSVNVGEL